MTKVFSDTGLVVVFKSGTEKLGRYKLRDKPQGRGSGRHCLTGTGIQEPVTSRDASIVINKMFASMQTRPWESVTVSFGSSKATIVGGSPRHGASRAKIFLDSPLPSITAVVLGWKREGKRVTRACNGYADAVLAIAEAESRYNI